MNITDFALVLVFVTVGCDGVLGSSARLDKCGVCGGGGETCTVVQGIFTRSRLRSGYNVLFSIPQGACRISLAQKGQSRNYLALNNTAARRGKGSFLNGNWRLNSPGEYDAAGTTWHYDRKFTSTGVSEEKVRADGPTSAKVEVLLLYQGTSPRIEYRYSLPKTQANKLPSRPKKPQQHSKSQPSHPSRNSKSEQQGLGDTNQEAKTTAAEGSKKHRNVNYSQKGFHNPKREGKLHKEDSSQNPLSAHVSYVGPNMTVVGPQPLRIRQPVRVSSATDGNSRVKLAHYGSLGPVSALRGRTGGLQDTRVYSYNWRIKGLTECSEPCGGGTQTPQLLCVQAETRVTVTDDNCRSARKPSVHRVSCNSQDCPAEWSAGEWVACSKPCGRGHQQRQVTCTRRVQGVKLQISDAQCANAGMPIVQRACTVQPCHKWQVGHWGDCSVSCGTGLRSRQVTCTNTLSQLEEKDVSKCPVRRPHDQEDCNPGSCSQGWYFSHWQNHCSAECGEESQGLKYRSVLCLSPPCGAAERPKSSLDCVGSSKCGPRWFAGPWSTCSERCGRGEQTREVVCVRGEGHDLEVNVEGCESSAKPDTRQTCHGDQCESRWYMTQWGECSGSCGQGQRSRKVTCLGREGKPSDSCSLGARPISHETCSLPACNTGQPAISNKCKDKYQRCKMVVQARLCQVRYYNQLCCKSCQIHKHQHRLRQT